MAKVEGSQPPVSLEDVVAVVAKQCGVNRHTVKVEVCAPTFNFFVRFREVEDCTRVLHAKWSLIVNSETLAVRR
jgi:hypothetical protein